MNNRLLATFLAVDGNPDRELSRGEIQALMDAYPDRWTDSDKSCFRMDSAAALYNLRTREFGPLTITQAAVVVGDLEALRFLTLDCNSNLSLQALTDGLSTYILSEIRKVQEEVISRCIHRDQQSIGSFLSDSYLRFRTRGVNFNVGDWETRMAVEIVKKDPKFRVYFELGEAIDAFNKTNDPKLNQWKNNQTMANRQNGIMQGIPQAPAAVVDIINQYDFSYLVDVTKAETALQYFDYVRLEKEKAYHVGDLARDFLSFITSDQTWKREALRENNNANHNHSSSSVASSSSSLSLAAASSPAASSSSSSPASSSTAYHFGDFIRNLMSYIMNDETWKREALQKSDESNNDGPKNKK